MSDKKLSMPVKVVLMLLFVVLVGAIVYNQFALSEQQDALRRDIEGIQASLSATPVVTIIPEATPSATPTVEPTVAQRVSPKISVSPTN